MGLRSISADNACALSGRATRSKTGDNRTVEEDRQWLSSYGTLLTTSGLGMLYVIYDMFFIKSP